MLIHKKTSKICEYEKVSKICKYKINSFFPHIPPSFNEKLTLLLRK